MATNSTMPTPSSTEGEQFLCDDWFDPLENGVRTRIRGFIEELLEAELDAALGRARYERPGAGGGGSPESSAGGVTPETAWRSLLWIWRGVTTGTASDTSYVYRLSDAARYSWRLLRW